MLFTFKSSVKKTFFCLHSHYHGNGSCEYRFYIIFHKIFTKYNFRSHAANVLEIWICCSPPNVPGEHFFLFTFLLHTYAFNLFLDKICLSCISSLWERNLYCIKKGTTPKSYKSFMQPSKTLL